MTLNIGDISKSEYEVVVIGGGPAGFSAAISSARKGAKTLLVEQAGFCGGMATQGLVGPFMTCFDAKGEEMIIKGIFKEVVDKMIAVNSAIDPSTVYGGTAYTSWIKIGHDHVTPFEPEALKTVMEEMLLEAGVKIMYHTTFTSPVTDGDKVIGVNVFSKSGNKQILAKVVIDCSGDADVVARSGAEFFYGNEEGNFVQPATMFFRIGNCDSEKIEKEIQEHINDFYRKDGVNYRSFHWLVSKAKENGDWHLQRTSIGLFKGVKDDEWFVNTSRLMGVNSTDVDSLTKGEIDGRQQVKEIFAFIKKYIPGCENARLLCSGSTLGVRESRHIIGKKKLVLEDIENGVVPEDTILLCGNSVDVHGRFGPLSNEYITVKNGKWYGVPYGVLVPEKLKGILVAGRSVSASSEAAGAIRVMPPCFGMGQAAGTAAVMSIQEKCDVADVNVQKLRTILKNDGCFL